MCSYITNNVEVSGAAKGSAAWFSLSSACVSYDHPYHSGFNHSLNIDFLNAGDGPESRVAVELSRDSAFELAQAIFACIKAGDEAHLS
jgi:hypothetical protein